MRTSLSRDLTTPPANERPASLFSPSGVLALEGGLALRGRLRGAATPAQGDLIFSTAATGWGEILTDPSYEGQIVVLTHPMAGNAVAALVSAGQALADFGIWLLIVGLPILLVVAVIAWLALRFRPLGRRLVGAGGRTSAADE